MATPLLIHLRLQGYRVASMSSASSTTSAGSSMRDQSAQRLFVRVTDQRSGLDCGGAELQQGPTHNPGQPSQQTSCSYAAAQGTSPAPRPAPPSPLPPSSCPVPLEAREALNPATNMPKSLSEPSTSSSSASTQSQLNLQRQASTIPMAPLDAVPKHQEGSEQQVWMYPSEHMFFNAMKRKGWDPRETDMPAVVAIHNSVNERAWREVLVWEGMHASECAMPRLKKFQGKPSEYSPKARLLNTLGFALPFDRHDWIVDRCGKEVRYIIDFYSTKPQPGAPVGMFIDARPALDSFEAAWDRVKLQFSWITSGRWMR